MSPNFLAKSSATASAFQPAMDQTIPSDPESMNEHVAGPSTDPDSYDPEILWDKAYARLREENMELVEAYESLLTNTASIQEGLPVRKTMKALVDNRVEVMTKREWKIRIPWRQEPMVIRDLVDKIVNVVLKFKDFANVATSIDPIHVGIPVAGICVLLPVSNPLLLCFSQELMKLLQFITGDSQERASALEGLAWVTELVDLYSEVEKIYPRARESRLTKQFSEKLENLYFQILDFLARAACSFDRKTIKRVAVNILKIEDWSGKLDVIKASNEKCREFADEYHWLEQRTGMEVINDLMQRQTQAIEELLIESKLRSNESKKIISWVSRINFESVHSGHREKLGLHYQHSGQWLRPRYNAWLASADQPTLWLCGSGL